VNAPDVNVPRATAWLNQWSTNKNTILELRTGCNRLVEEAAVEVASHHHSSAQ
jgi:hypothetical protein